MKVSVAGHSTGVGGTAPAKRTLKRKRPDNGVASAEDDGPTDSARTEAAQKGIPVLPWMRLPITIEAGTGVPLEDVKGLDSRLQIALKKGAVTELFPVQAVAWQVLAGGHSTAHDLCISAPTGSGKTLAYALPILQGLSQRCVPRLQVLAVLPTRDLAQQVYDVFAGLAPALGLRVALVAGRGTLVEEAAALTGEGMAVDIAVATPGRLVAHMHDTPGFTLQHLRFLVVDETDRLLRQSYQDWLPHVLAATSSPPASLQRADSPGRGSPPRPDEQHPTAAPAAQPPPPAKHGPGPRLQNCWADAGLQQDQATPRRVVKLVVSATLTRDPGKIERLGLHRPRFVALSGADHRYALPPRLHEHRLIAPAEGKPLHLAALLSDLAGQPTIVFTASVQATHRLHAFLAALDTFRDRTVEYSSAVPPKQRAASLAAFRGGQASVLIASDAMTRGMDVKGVANVVSYDVPIYAKTYVHRAGRTARAGRTGRVFTILRPEEVRHFKDVVRKVGNSHVLDYRLAVEKLEALRPAVAAAVQAALEEPAVA